MNFKRTKCNYCSRWKWWEDIDLSEIMMFIFFAFLAVLLGCAASLAVYGTHGVITGKWSSPDVVKAGVK